MPLLNARRMHGAVHLFDRLPQIDRQSRRSAPRLAVPVRTVPLVGVIRNQRSHRNGGKRPELPGSADLLIETPSTRGELQAILTRFADKQIDYLVIDGGDGTIRDVLTFGAGIFGADWPPIIVLPAGKTNALAKDLKVPAHWSLADALAAAQAGKVAHRQPVVICQRDNPDARVYGFIFGAGAFTAAIGVGQDAHRRGAFNSLAVGITAVWSLFSALFAPTGNPLREGTRMKLSDADGRPLPHSGVGSEDERFLVFASTLELFPAGMRPFHGLPGKLRLSIIDNSRPAMLLSMPLIVSGRIGDRLRRMGCHRAALDSFQIDIEDRFILDGEAFPAGSYHLSLAPELRFVAP